MSATISVIIPLYNKKKYIQRTIDSVLGQTFRDFELIIVDSSDDGSCEIVEKNTDPRIIHLRRQERTYLPISRNIGALHATSDLLAFIDADDEWMPSHLETLLRLASIYPEAGVYATPYIKLFPDGSLMAMIFAEIPPPPWEGYIRNYLRTCSLGDVPVCSSSSAVRKNVFVGMGGFDERLIHGGEDQHFWGRIALKHPVAFSWKGPAIYHTEASGRMCNDPGPAYGDPFSDHLRGLLDRGEILPDQVPDVEAYINRRNTTVWSGSILKKQPQTGTSGCQAGEGTSGNLLSWIRNLPASVIRIYFNSRVRDAGRRLRCRIHGWHVPAMDGD